MLNRKDPLSDLTKKLNKLREHFKARNALLKQYDDLYYLKHYTSSALPGEERVIVNTPTNIVDLAVGALSSNPLKIHAYRMREDEQGIGESTDVEKLLRGCLFINSERQERDMELDVIFQVVNGGCAVRTYWNMDLQEPVIKTFEAIEAGEIPMQDVTYSELPVFMDVIPARYIYYQRGGKGGVLQYVIYCCERELLDVESEWDWKSKDHKTKNKEGIKVEYVDYWGRTDNGAIENAVCIDGKEWVKKPTETEYPDIPYTLFSGRPTPAEKAEHESLGILFTVLDQIPDLERQLNHIRRLVNVYTSMPLIVTTRGGTERPVIDPVISVVHLREGESVSFPVWPGTPPDVQAMIAHTQAQIQEGSFPSASYGQGPSAISGYAISLLAEAGRTRLYQFQRSLEQGWSTVFRKILGMAQVLAPNVQLPVYGRLKGEPYTMEITGGQMAGFRVDVSLKPLFPQDKMRDFNMATMAKSQQMLSTKTIQEELLGVESPDDEQQRMLVEAAMQNPELVKAMINRALEEYGIAPIPPQGPPQTQPQVPQGMPAPETLQQNVEAQTLAGQPPVSDMQGAMPPAAVMPQEMAGIMPPQGVGMAPPGQGPLPPELMDMVAKIAGMGRP